MVIFGDFYPWLTPAWAWWSAGTWTADWPAERLLLWPSGWLTPSSCPSMWWGTTPSTEQWYLLVCGVRGWTMDTGMNWQDLSTICSKMCVWVQKVSLNSLILISGKSAWMVQRPRSVLVIQMDVACVEESVCCTRLLSVSRVSFSTLETIPYPENRWKIQFCWSSRESGAEDDVSWGMSSSWSPWLAVLLNFKETDSLSMTWETMNCQWQLK